MSTCIDSKEGAIRSMSTLSLEPEVTFNVKNKLCWFHQIQFVPKRNSHYQQVPTLRVCSYLNCLRKESKRKEFKPCKKCKNDHTLAHPFYYCSKECQGML